MSMQSERHSRLYRAGAFSKSSGGWAVLGEPKSLADAAAELESWQIAGLLTKLILPCDCTCGELACTCEAKGGAK